MNSIGSATSTTFAEPSAPSSMARVTTVGAAVAVALVAAGVLVSGVFDRLNEPLLFGLSAGIVVMLLAYVAATLAAHRRGASNVMLRVLALVGFTAVVFLRRRPAAAGRDVAEAWSSLRASQRTLLGSAILAASAAGLLLLPIALPVKHETVHAVASASMSADHAALEREIAALANAPDAPPGAELVIRGMMSGLTGEPLREEPIAFSYFSETHLFFVLPGLVMLLVAALSLAGRGRARPMSAPLRR